MSRIGKSTEIEISSCQGLDEGAGIWVTATRYRVSLLYERNIIKLVGMISPVCEYTKNHLCTLKGVFHDV